MVGSPPFAMTMRSSLVVGSQSFLGDELNRYIWYIWFVYIYIMYTYLYICIYMYIYIFHVLYVHMLHNTYIQLWQQKSAWISVAAGAVPWPRNGIHCSGCSRKVFQLTTFLSTFGFCCTRSQRNSNFMLILRISALFDSFCALCWEDCKTGTAWHRSTLKRTPFQKAGFRAIQTNVPRTWYVDWMMFQCVSGGSTLVCTVSFRCCSESWLHWPLNLLNTLSSSNLRMI